MVKFMELIIDQRNYKDGMLIPEVYTKARQEILKLNKTSSLEEVKFLTDLLDNAESAKDACNILVNAELNYLNASHQLNCAILSLHVLKSKGYLN